MRGKRTEHTKSDSRQRFNIQQSGRLGEETWEGGGREPMDPDDIEAETEQLGKIATKQQLRSDDN